MARFSLARVPYYIAVSIYMAFVAIVSYVNNTKATGATSDVYLGAVVLSVVLGLMSLNYMLFAKGHFDDEVDTEVAGVTLSKKYFYLGVLLVAVWRAIVGYQLNHGGVGVESTYGVIWLGTSLGVALFTFANYRSYMARQ